MVLDGASIAEMGTHKELMKNKQGLYNKMFTAQGEYYKS
jgi:ABC-type multidrug transport system fused ATPase/permease subunit